jgi:hypothetical protein
LLRNPQQPLLVIAPEPEWRELSSKPGAPRKSRARSAAKKKTRKKKKDGA